MNIKLVDAASKLAAILKTAVGVTRDELIVYIINKNIQQNIPPFYDGFKVTVKYIGYIKPC